MVDKVAYELIQWPECRSSDRPPAISADEYEKRLNRVYEIMKNLSLTHVIIYGDREHFANILYMTGYDPRFEETLLIISLSSTPLILVGNEGAGYVHVSLPVRNGKIRTELFQSLSLQSQPRDSSRLLKDIVQSEGINTESHVGIAGIKYYHEGEIAKTGKEYLLDIPSYMVDTVREIAGYENVTNVTDIFTHPSYGMRSTASPSEIAFFEYTNSLAAKNVKEVLFSMEESITDLEAIQNGHLEGIPQGCHIVFCTGENLPFGMTSPTGELLKRGQAASFNICYRGANICRAGWLASDLSELPEPAQDYLEDFAFPYFLAMIKWLDMLRIGALGGEIYSAMEELLPFEKYGVTLNPGHLIHYDEWIGSPIYKGSTIPLQSGMIVQSDIIPSSKEYYSCRMEEGYLLADKELVSALKSNYPELHARCLQRKEYMKENIGISLPDELFPLSDICGIVPPLFFSPSKVMKLVSG